MPGIDPGQNNGVTGLLDLSAAAPAKFAVTAAAWAAGLSVLMLDAGGRGDGRFPERRPIGTSGSVNVSGKVRVDAYPAPTVFKGEAGTLILQLTTDITTAYPVKVTGVKYVKAAKDTGLWDVTFTCEVAGEPTATGFGGEQPTPASQFYFSKEQWAVTSKTLDPNALQSAAVRRYLAVPAADDDAAEATELAGILALVAVPLPGMKYRTAALHRISAQFAWVDVVFGLTDTAEDVINANTSTTVDPRGLASRAATAAINGTPATPTGDAFVNRGTTTTELNDANVLTRADWGLRSTEDDVEMPGTVTGNDPYDLGDNASITDVTASSTPPSVPAAPVGQHVETESERLNAGHWRHLFKYANTNAKQRVEFEGTQTQLDPSGLQEEDRQTVVNESSTPPATPTPSPAALHLRRRVSRRISGTPEKWAHAFEFARRTTLDDVQMDGTRTDADPNALKGRP